MTGMSDRPTWQIIAGTGVLAVLLCVGIFAVVGLSLAATR